MTTPAHTAHADQLAATLRDARNFHDGEPCDPFTPCRSCQVGRMTVQVERRLALIPTQRTAQEA